MLRIRQSFVVLLFLAAAPASVSACLWDSDTLKQERARFPSALELITGKFLRHSAEFYRWRIEDRLRRLKSHPDEPALYDDLAVAYQKTGQHQMAVDTMLAKEKLFPGLYETYSNLGTFYILAGEFEEGLPYIDRALAINPDAHFGREKYQKWLVEYAMSRRIDGRLSFPLEKPEDRRRGRSGFHVFLQERLGSQTLTLQELQKAVHGILGMMRFADHENPLLLETLGDLLWDIEQRKVDAKRLAARVYLKASYGTEKEAVRRDYRELAKLALVTQSDDNPNPFLMDNLTLSAVEREFAGELKEAEAWYADLKADELRWIQESEDPEAEFDRQYTSRGEPTVRQPLGTVFRVALVVGIALILGVTILLLRRRSRLARARALVPAHTTEQ